VQAVIGHPLTVYGKGGQTRGYLNIRDTMQCVRLATENPADPGELRVYNQFTEQFGVLELAERVTHAAATLGIDATIEHTDNPRKELERHYYNAKHTKLLDLGLEPRLLNDELIDTMLVRIREHADRIDHSTLVQNVRWVPESSGPTRSAARDTTRA
jgi:UDP-sulfoquinovose synthase